ncbi:MAG: PTS system mannose/fructose/sorbose family transporter subunit IID [Elusimicrobia bacterium]|nr:PTS system mannose/fructose/sorbose family transporter subunit IID [Elusimicrobiota bacterium]
MMNWKRRTEIFLRSLFLQACWNWERMQNFGFAFCVEPGLRRIYTGEALREARLRHLDTFNTQPYLAGMIAGVVLRMERVAANGDGRVERIETLKRALATALAAIGDVCFWAKLRPLSVAAALTVGSVVWVLGGAARGGFLAGAGVFLGLFNLPAVWIRWAGIRLGYENGEAVAAAIERMNCQRLIGRLQNAGRVATAVLAALALAAWPLAAGRGWKEALAHGMIFAACLLLQAHPISVLRAYGALVAAGLFGALTLQ